MADSIRGLEVITKKRKLDEDNDVPTKKQRLNNVFEEYNYARTMTNTEELPENVSYEENFNYLNRISFQIINSFGFLIGPNRNLQCAIGCQ